MKYLVLPLSIATVAAFASVGSGTEGEASLVSKAVSLPSIVIAPDGIQLSAYRACARKTESVVLPLAEATACLDAYTRLKLSFLPDIQFEEYMRLPPAQRWEANKRAFAAYSEWLDAEGNTE